MRALPTIPPSEDLAGRDAVSRPGVRGWRLYLIVATALAPLCTPVLPAHLAGLDLLNGVALAVFVLALLSGSRAPQLPFALPMILIGAGSLIAMTRAESLGAGALAIAQDVYLYTWFALVVSVIRTPADIRAMRIAWLWTSVVVSLIGIAGALVAGGWSPALLLAARGPRVTSTFYNPNMLADYLVISVFIAVSLGNAVPRPARWGALGALMLGLIATKSNGGIVAFAAGLIAWGVARSLVPGRAVLRTAAVMAGALAALALLTWGALGWGLGAPVLSAIRDRTFAARMSHSTASRLRIWEQLERAYERSPLGLGPGNASAVQLSLAQRERPDSYRSKEPHSDYLGYAIERGPLGFVGLLLFTGFAMACLVRFSRRAPRLRGEWPDAQRWSAALWGIFVASSVHSLVIEKLHFRHFWLALAMAVASASVASALTRRAASSVAPAARVPVRHALLPAAGRAFLPAVGHAFLPAAQRVRTQLVLGASTPGERT